MVYTVVAITEVGTPQAPAWALRDERGEFLTLERKIYRGQTLRAVEMTAEKHLPPGSIVVWPWTVQGWP